MHLVYDDSLVREELGYRPAIGTMEGLCLQLLEWNEKVEIEIEAKRTEGKWDGAVASDTNKDAGQSRRQCNPRCPSYG